jgi:cell wall-associated NlpC family hydrolase
MSSAELARAARALIDVPYRCNGRDPATGLDCLGVVAAALAAIGRAASLPPRSTLRRRNLPEIGAIARAAGLDDADGAVEPGDILLVRCSPVQWHALVAVATERFVHAHAGLRRVVLSPADRTWTHAGHWRLPPPLEE